MVRRIYSIKDDLTGFSSVIADDSDELASRGFESTVRRMLAADRASAPYVDDMSLWFVGTFDIDSGVLSGGTPSLVVRGKSIRLMVDRESLVNAVKEDADEEV